MQVHRASFTLHGAFMLLPAASPVSVPVHSPTLDNRNINEGGCCNYQRPANMLFYQHKTKQHHVHVSAKSSEPADWPLVNGAYWLTVFWSRESKAFKFSILPPVLNVLKIRKRALEFTINKKCKHQTRHNTNNRVNTIVLASLGIDKTTLHLHWYTCGYP